MKREKLITITAETTSETDGVFEDITYDLTRADLQLILNALEIIEPVTAAAQRRAANLELVFRNLLR